VKISKTKFNQLLKEELAALNEGEWDVSKRTAFPRVVSQILSALREAQDIVDGGHLDEKEPTSADTIEKIKEIFDHPMLDKLKELAGIDVNVRITDHEEERAGYDDQRINDIVDETVALSANPDKIRQALELGIKGLRQGIEPGRKLGVYITDAWWGSYASQFDLNDENIINDALKQIIPLIKKGSEGKNK
tara:strand:- start:762 stop:1334 length:573 start_codon:yes stop_codon:yes gene_type:complete